MNKASKMMLRWLGLISAIIIVTGLTSCSKVEDERNDETIPTKETVVTVDDKDLPEESTNDEIVDPNVSKDSDHKSVASVDSKKPEVDGRNQKDTSRKLHPEAGIHGAGPVGDGKDFAEIRDIDGNVIVTLENESGLIPVENGIVYTGREKNGEKSIYSYLYYDFDSKETTLLGSVEDIIAVMSYDNMYIDNDLYILLTDRDYNSFLCIIDTKELTFKKVALGTNMSLYNSMTYYDGFVYYFTADTMYTEAIYRYDPRDDEITKLWDYDFDYITFTDDKLLHLATDADHLYILKVESRGENTSRLFVDMYDNKLNLVERTELTDRIREFTKDLITEEIYGKERAEQRIDEEIRQPVLEFDIRNGVLYYQSLGLIRLLEEFVPGNSSNSKDIMKMDSYVIGAKSTDITDGDYCFYDIKSRCIYLYDPYKSELQKGKIIVNGESVDLFGIQYGPGGKLLIYDSHITGPFSERTTPFYYIDKTDLVQVE